MPRTKRTSEPQPPKPHASGPSLTYARRIERGRPNVTLTLDEAINEALYALSERLAMPRSHVVEEAIRLLAAREKIKIIDKG